MSLQQQAESSSSVTNEKQQPQKHQKVKVKGLLPKPSLPTFREARKAMNEKGKSFLELVKAVKIMDKVQHSTNRYQSYELDRDMDDTGTLAYDILLKWTERDLTEKFQLFFRDMSPLVKSLPLTIHHNSKGKLAQVIITHLQAEDQIAFEAIFE
jgi:hypothetical protein